MGRLGHHNHLVRRRLRTGGGVCVCRCVGGQVRVERLLEGRADVVCDRILTPEIVQEVIGDIDGEEAEREPDQGESQEESHRCGL